MESGGSSINEEYPEEGVEDVEDNIFLGLFEQRQALAVIRLGSSLIDFCSRLSTGS